MKVTQEQNMYSLTIMMVKNILASNFY